MVNPRRVRDFAKVPCRLAETDRVDAAVLARFAETVRPEPRPLADEASWELSAPVAGGRQLLFESHPRWLRKEVERAEVELDRIIRENLVWREKDTLLRSVPGVGPAVSATPARGPPRARVSRPQTARRPGRRDAHEQGLGHATRAANGVGRPLGGADDPLHGGTGGHPLQPDHKGVLRAPALERQAENGRPKKVALMACMRKLLTILGAVLCGSFRA